MFREPENIKSDKWVWWVRYTDIIDPIKAPELIDALYELLCDVLKNYKDQMKI